MTNATCPFCNTLLTEYKATVCPRCGEPLGRGPVDGAPIPTFHQHQPPARKSENRKFATGALVLMGIMAVGGLTLALVTLGQRQNRHPKPELYAPQSFGPGELPALGYLPEGCNLIAGVHLSDLLKSELGKEFLASPPDFLRLGLEWTQRWSGLGLEAIDHIVVGTALKDEIPQITAVVRTRLPFRIEDVARLYSGRPLPHHGTPLFRLKLEPTGGGYLWCAEPRTLIFVVRPDAVKIEDMDSIPAKPRQGLEGLPAALRPVVGQRLRQSTLWLAGLVEAPPALDMFAQLARLPLDKVPFLSQVKVFGLGLLLQEDLTCIGAIECRNPDSARQAQAILEKWTFAGMKSLKVVGPPPTPGPEAHWVNWQVRADVAAFQRLFLDKRRPP
jgi:hypothetical protein